MRILVLCIFFLPAELWGQSATFAVSGRVVDAGSRQPLAGASVFCQNTTVGTVTKENGEFSLVMNNGGYDLVVSFTGYETQITHVSNNITESGQLTLLMKPREKNLEEVSIQVSNEVQDGWNVYGAFFKENFIGQTSNSNQFVIQNPEAIHFYFSKKKNRLKILAREDLIFMNEALGYKIKYQLDSFTHEYGSGITTFTGYPYFEELPGSDEQKANWKKNREIAYYGSILHFMRAYHDSSLKKEGFRVELVDSATNQSRAINNPYDSAYFIRTDGNDVELHFPGSVRVVYLNEKPEALYLQTNNLSPRTTVQISLLNLQDPIVIEENGYFFDQHDILSLGYWGWEKMADALPYDYYPK